MTHPGSQKGSWFPLVTPGSVPVPVLWWSARLLVLLWWRYQNQPCVPGVRKRLRVAGIDSHTGLQVGGGGGRGGGGEGEEGEGGRGREGGREGGRGL